MKFKRSANSYLKHYFVRNKKLKTTGERIVEKNKNEV